MQPLLIVRHTAHVLPGYLQTILQQQGLPFHIITLDSGAPLPADLDDYSALVLLGGTMSVNDELEWLQAELALIRRAHETDMPVLGICLGGQLIARALGAQVKAGHSQEIGWTTVSKTPDGRHSPFVAGLEEIFPVFQWHGDTFAIPDGAKHLLRNDCYENQAFSIGRMLALQFHPEMTTAMICHWLQSSELDRRQPCVQAPQAMLDNLEQRVAGLNRVAKRLVSNWLGSCSV